MNTQPSPAAVLWTGGKDSALALHRAVRAGLDVTALVTFKPETADFRAHPLELIKRQADAAGLPHRTVPIAEPYEAGYEQAITDLKRKGIATLVTGDIDLVDGHPNWIRERSAPCGMHVETPLWHADRPALWDELLACGFRVVVTCVATPYLDDSWVGRTVDRNALAELCALSRETGIDACGENGEFHTMVTDAPGFKTPIDLGPAAVHNKSPYRYAVFEGNTDT